MPDYPDRAVLEGVVNALIHRNYMEIGSEVHIDMFDDRIEIYSPGGMVSGISLEMIRVWLESTIGNLLAKRKRLQCIGLHEKV